MEDVFAGTIENCRCAVIVAHPDDETLWAGGTILSNPANDWTIVATCRKNDPDRAPKFYAVLKALKATGCMGDMDDSPEQMPLDDARVQDTILSILQHREYDLIVTHSTQGEYTRHRRHEEIGKAVIGLIESERLKTRHLLMFAYTDNDRANLPMPITNADRIVSLPADIWNRKYEIITQTYGFNKDSWEAKTTPLKEAFWSFRSTTNIKEHIKERFAI